jgi:hypothetical protein
MPELKAASSGPVSHRSSVRRRERGLPDNNPPTYVSLCAQHECILHYRTPPTDAHTPGALRMRQWTEGPASYERGRGSIGGCTDPSASKRLGIRCISGVMRSTRSARLHSSAHKSFLRAKYSCACSLPNDAPLPFNWNSITIWIHRTDLRTFSKHQYE